MSVIAAVLLVCGSACAEVEQDVELHRVIGGLYALAGAAETAGESANVNQVSRFFTNLPEGWQNSVQISRVKGSLWAGIAVDKFSSARRYLRANAAALNITESPEGYAWLGGDFAWLNVSSLELRAARGTGRDSDVIFFTADGGAKWWAASPDFTKRAAGEIIKKFGIKNAPELHRPSGVRESIYESVKPSDVHKPSDMHVGRRRSSFDMDIPIGKNIILDPIPNRPRH